MCSNWCHTLYVVTERRRQVNVRLSPEEKRRLDDAAAKRGLSPSSLVRMLIKSEFDRVTKGEAAE